jgi:hypothetical protein
MTTLRKLAGQADADNCGSARAGHHPSPLADLVTAVLCAARPDAEPAGLGCLPTVLMAAKTQVAGPCAAAAGASVLGQPSVRLGGRGTRPTRGTPRSLAAVCLASGRRLSEAASAVSGGGCAAARISFWRLRRSCEPKGAEPVIQQPCWGRTRSWPPLRALICRVGRAYAHVRAAPEFRGGAGAVWAAVLPDLRVVTMTQEPLPQKASRKQRTNASSRMVQANACLIGSWEICRRICAGGNGCCGWRRLSLPRRSR